MEWVVGIGIGLFLFVRFPRQMLIVTGAVVLIGGAIFGGVTFYENQRAEDAKRLRESVVITASFDAGRCGAEYPLVVSFENRNTETLLSVSFRLAGYRDGHSNPVYESLSIDADRIIGPGETHKACWSVPAAAYDAGTPPPPQDVTWRATVSYPTFGTPP